MTLVQGGEDSDNSPAPSRADGEPAHGKRSEAASASTRPDEVEVDVGASGRKKEERGADRFYVGYWNEPLCSYKTLMPWQRICRWREQGEPGKAVGQRALLGPRVADCWAVAGLSSLPSCGQRGRGCSGRSLQER